MEKLRTMEDVAAIFKNNYENCQVLSCLRDLSASLVSRFSEPRLLQQIQPPPAIAIFMVI